MLRGLKQTLCTPGPRKPKETETELCLSISCEGLGEQWAATGTGALGAADLGKEMGTHSGILDWRNPWTAEPGGLQSMGLQRVRHD